MAEAALLGGERLVFLALLQQVMLAVLEDSFRILQFTGHQDVEVHHRGVVFCNVGVPDGDFHELRSGSALGLRMEPVPQHTGIWLRHRGLWRRLLQHAEVRPKIDVIGGTVDDECGHGFDSGGLGFGGAALGLAEMDDLDIEAARVERGGNVLFGGDADGATGVIECGFGFHVDV